MAFNKNKALENALKFLNQGRVAQAIGEYQQILRNDPKDQATLMTVGDLFARQGDMPQAIEYFERLAQVYLNDGFNSKAIAIYKKIAKLAPAELPPLERLADLYVQQGVLSEARPLFLQIAEAHLKANRAPKAVELLHRLLDVEPENPRVQMRLAELYNVMGQKKEAAQTYFAYAQRLFDRGENDEAQKLIERALGVDAASGGALLLKAKILGASQKKDQAIAILDNHPEVDAGGEVTNLLVDLEVESGQLEKAADRARKQLARGSAHSKLLQRVVDCMIEAGQPGPALHVLRELRDPMIEAGEQEKFQTLLSSISEKLPGDTEPLEMLADFCRHTSDPFPLSAALSQLVDLYAAAGNYDRAEELMREMLDRNKGDERLVARLDQLRARRSGAPATPAEEVAPLSVAEVTSRKSAPAKEPLVEVQLSHAEPSEPDGTSEESFDEETQRYIAQALTDVDLFSSYGLTQKATHLLENVLQRAPRHTPTLERLLDLYLGAGNERRTAELAAQLEQIHRERGDTVNVDRFAELRQRFQKAAGMSEEELPAAPAAPEPAAAPAPVEAASAAPVAASPAPQAPAEFEIPLAPPEPEPAVAEAPAAVREPAHTKKDVTPVAAAPAAASEEVDLSDEWEAMAKDVAEPAPAAPPQAPPAPVPVAAEPERIEIEVPAEPEPIEILEATVEPPAEPQIEIVEEAAEEAPAAEPVAAKSADIELELTPEPAGARGKNGAATTEDFLSELAAEIDDMETPAAPPAKAPAPPAASAQVPEVTAESLNELAEVFQEFRSELGELSDEDEDLETHYNLGIAYREMGLLDEAIGEFQKVAKAVEKGKPFRYAMNCSTMLALSFMDKNEPKIAALWYKRALNTPGLDQEAVLALRYDLGVSLDLAGEADAALDSFRQVYAMNIDYRDVADRIATLQKQ
ncbi:MAG TPA: tetratricopeptide repeat protein [Candidatus Acidoferrales bacterium]|nr:tetratricopeptide repeat protein [Candidatus Acidoferrales bacterium]